TPDKYGDLETMLRVQSWIGPVIHHMKMEELTESGQIVPANIFILPMTAVPITDTYQEEVQLGIINNPYRNATITAIASYYAETDTGPVVVLCERIEHGEKLAEKLECPFINGKTPSARREKVWEGIRGGSINLVVLSTIADEGLDLPNLSYLILAGGGKASHKAIQRIGRGLRSSEGKSELFVFDMMDQGKYLRKHSLNRKATYLAEPAYQVVETSVEEVLS
ncbi:hypothetical protein LCGC14_2460450, partial [marine sediment metagenome]